MLCNEMHLGCSDLDFYRDAVIPDNDGVQGSVAIVFGILDVILCSVGHWLPHLVHLQVVEEDLLEDCAKVCTESKF